MLICVFLIFMSYEKAAEAADFIRSKYPRDDRARRSFSAAVWVRLPTSLTNAVRIPYEEIPGFARSTVEGHAGQLVLGEIDGVPVAVQQGRFHYYEGYEMEQVMLPVRTFGLMGIKNLILTNAAGSLDLGYDARQSDADHGPSELHGS